MEREATELEQDESEEQQENIGDQQTIPNGTDDEQEELEGDEVEIMYVDYSHMVEARLGDNDFDTGHVSQTGFSRSPSPSSSDKSLSPAQPPPPRQGFLSGVGLGTGVSDPRSCPAIGHSQKSQEKA